MRLHGTRIFKQESDLIVAEDQARIMYSQMKGEKQDATRASQTKITPGGTGNSEVLAGGAPYKKDSTLRLYGCSLPEDLGIIANEVPDITQIASSRGSGVPAPLIRV